MQTLTPNRIPNNMFLNFRFHALAKGKAQLFHSHSVRPSACVCHEMSRTQFSPISGPWQDVLKNAKVTPEIMRPKK